MSEKKKKLTGKQGELMRALDITPDDLEANDAGYITDNQRETVVKRQRYERMPFFALWIVFSLMPLFFLGIGLATGSDDMQVLLILSAFFFAIGQAMGGVNVWLQSRLNNELGENNVKTVQGIAVVNIGDSTSVLEIGGMKLKASADVLRRVEHLEPYVVHYLPNSKVVLSMQPVDEDGNMREGIARSRLEDVAGGDEVAYYDDDEQQQTASQ